MITRNFGQYLKLQLEMPHKSDFLLNLVNNTLPIKYLILNRGNQFIWILKQIVKYKAFRAHIV